MPSRAFTSAKNKLLSKQFGTTLSSRFKANEDEFQAARVGSSLVAIDGQLYPGAIAGDAATVTNAGRPAAAQYTAGGGGAIVISGSNGGTGGNGSGFVMDTPGTLSSTSTNVAGGQHTHAIDMTIARAPLPLTAITLDSNTTVGHTHNIDASYDPDLTSKIIKSNTAGQVILRELRLRDSLGGASGITYDGVGLKFEDGFRSDPDDRTSYSGRAAWGHVGWNDHAGFSHRSHVGPNNYAFLQNSTGGTFVNAAPGQNIYHRVNNVDVLLMNSTALSVSSASSATLRSDNYISQLTGWGITYPGAGDFRYLYTDELHAKAFIADLEQALAGGQIICKSVTTLARDFRAPYPGAYATLYVDDLPSAENMQVFQANDYIRLRNFSRAGGGLDISNCWGIVSSPADLADKQQTWRYTRSGTTTYSVIGWRTANATSSINSTAIALSKPTGTVANDVIIASVCYVANAGQTVTVSPAGWVRIYKHTHTNGTLTNEAWYKVAGSSEPASYTFTLSAAAICGGAIQAYSNCIMVGSPIDQYNVQSNTGITTMPAGSLTPISARAGAVFIGAAASNVAISPPGGMSEQIDTGVTGLRIYMANQTTAVQTALTLTATIGSVVDNIGAMILLMPAYTSALDAQTGHMQPGQTVGAKSIVLDYGVSGNGFYEVNAIDGLYGANSPYAQVATWTGHPGTGTALRTRLGNLRGVFGVDGEYGLFTGTGAAVTDQYLRLSSYTNEIHNLPIKMYNGSNLFFNADTTGLNYYADPNDSFASFNDRAALNFRRSDGTRVLRLGGFAFGNVSHYGMLEVPAGPSGPSQLVISARAPAGETASIEFQNSVGGATASWGFNRLGTGVNSAHFGSYLALLYDPVISPNFGLPNHYGQLLIQPSSDNQDAFISIKTTRSGTDRTWLIGAGSGAGVTDFRIHDYTGGVDRLSIDLGGNLSINGTLGGAWVTPAYGTNWTDLAGGFGGIRYRKLGDMVMLQGVANTTGSGGTTVATLPIGYRPNENRVFVVSSHYGAIRLDVNSAGTITTPGTTFTGANQWISLNGITFYTT